MSHDESIRAADDAAPVLDSEHLLRRLPNQPDQYDFDLKTPRFNAFLPSKRDVDGLSLNFDTTIFTVSICKASTRPERGQTFRIFVRLSASDFLPRASDMRQSAGRHRPPQCSLPRRYSKRPFLPLPRRSGRRSLLLHSRLEGRGMPSPKSCASWVAEHGRLRAHERW